MYNNLFLLKQLCIVAICFQFWQQKSAKYLINANFYFHHHRADVDVGLQRFGPDSGWVMNTVETRRQSELL